MSACILIIEDDRGSREMLSYLLRHAGYTILTAAHGGDGLSLIEKEHPDLVLCDLQMPVLDGYAVLHRVRNVADFNAIPMVAVSAFSMEGDRDRAKAAGFDGYFSKPIDPETFVAEMERFLPPHLIAGPGVPGEPSSIE